MKRPPSFPSGRLVARPARLVGLVALLLIGGCRLQVMDPNAFQTGRVLKRGEGRLSGSTVAYAPARASVDVGLGRGWEAGAGYGYLVAWGRSGDLSVTRSLYSSRRLFSSVLLQAELARGFDSVPPLGRVTGAAALSYWPWEGVGLYVPLRLSMLFASPATFRYTRRVWNDSLRRHVQVPGERVFNGLHDPVFTAGFGLANEYKRFYSRLALTFPVIGPHIERDSVNEGFELLPYLGFQLGVRVF